MSGRAAPRRIHYMPALRTALDSLAAAFADRYTLEHELGEGAMATVYLAHDLRHDRRVAIKVLREDVARTLGADRFLREIRLVARLNHPSVLALFDSGNVSAPAPGPGASESRPFLYYVMPYVEAGSLRDRLEQERQLPVEEAVRITAEVADALDHAHRHGIVHRDIKPENILLHEGHALVADFGIGKVLSEVEAEAFTHHGMTL